MSEITTPSQRATSSEDESHVNGWSDSRDQLKKIIEGVHNTTVEGSAKLHRIIQTDVISPFIKTFTEAAAAHAKLVEEMDNARELGTPLSQDALTRYRRATQERVLGPLNALLSVQISEQIYKSYAQLFNDLKESVAKQPATQVIPEPPNLYVPHDGDSLWTRTRKLHIRMSRRLHGTQRGVTNNLRRLWGKERITSPIDEQEIDLRKLLQFHTQVRIADIFIAEFKAIHDFLALHIVSYEKAQTAWTYELLKIELSLTAIPDESNEMDAWLRAEDRQPATLSEELSNRVMTAIELLQNCIKQIAEHPPFSFSIDEEIFNNCNDALYHDFKNDNTFFMRDRSLPDKEHLPVPQLQRLTAPRNVWYREVNNRLDMNTRLHELHDFILQRRAALLKTIARNTITPILTSFSRLRDAFSHLSDEIEGIFASTPENTNDHILQALKPLYQQIAYQFKSILNNVSDLNRARQVLETPGSIFWQDLKRSIIDLPEKVNLHEPLLEPSTRQEPAKHRYTIHFRELVQSALIEPISEALDGTADALHEAVIHSWEGIEQVESIVVNNLEAAFAQLSDEQAEGGKLNPPSDSEEEETPLAPVDEARGLILMGLTDATQKLDELVSTLQEPWKTLTQSVFVSTQAYADDILHDVMEQDNMNDPWTNYKVKVIRSTRKLRHATHQFFVNLSSLTGSFIKLVRHRTSQLIKKGQSAVGSATQSEDEWLSTIDEAFDLDALHKQKKLPRIYRRLFFPIPLTDLDFREGRTKDVDHVTEHFKQWHNSLTGPLLLAMPYGSGRTSFMNVLTDSVFAEADVHLITLLERVPDAHAFTLEIARALSIDHDESLTIDQLEAHIVAMTRAQKPRVIMVNKFEHMMLCLPGGHKAIERVLMFMSRTDNFIYWVINVNEHAWHFLKKTMRPSSGFISAYKTSDLKPDALEDIIIKRHKNSGKNLIFKTSLTSNWLSDFSWSNFRKSRQEILQYVFFDKLYHLAGQNILLALLYWLRAVEFDAEQDTIYVNVINPIEFSFLETLDLPRTFTLKSFLIHTTLTVEEHMLVFKLNETESTFILESLLNLRIIEPATPNPEEKIHFRIESNRPYRLHPLIVHPVLEMLKKKHIVY